MNNDSPRKRRVMTQSITASRVLDIWTDEMVDTRLLKEIIDTGVVVYG